MRSKTCLKREPDDILTRARDRFILHTLCQNDILEYYNEYEHCQCVRDLKLVPTFSIMMRTSDAFDPVNRQSNRSRQLGIIDR